MFKYSLKSNEMKLVGKIVNGGGPPPKCRR